MGVSNEKLAERGRDRKKEAIGRFKEEGEPIGAQQGRVGFSQ